MRLRFVLTVAVLSAASSLAAAQSATIRSFGDRRSDEFTLPIGADDCAENIELTFTVSGLTTANTLAVFYGSTCETGANRTGGGSTAQTCFPVVDDDYLALGTQDITLTAQDLDCDESEELDVSRNLFFLSLPSATDATDVSTGNILAFTPAIEVDTKRPSPPTGVAGDSGEVAIPIRWSLPTDTLRELIVYIDTEVGENCVSTMMTAGEEVDPNGLDVEDGLSPTSTGLTLRNAVEVGSKAAVGVVAVDLAGNVSVLSNIACIEGVPTTSWLDLHKAQGGKTGDTCSAAPMTTRTLATPFLWLGAIGFLWLRARRRVS